MISLTLTIWILNLMRDGRMFQGVHSTVIGDSHIRKGIVCQDSSGTVVTDKFAIALWQMDMAAPSISAAM